MHHFLSAQADFTNMFLFLMQDIYNYTINDWVQATDLLFFSMNIADVAVERTVNIWFLM